ncbi:hypothetical protein [Methanoregula sp. UBA64]|jgi:hypothetical protein|uniref:hypothetical protein n=1 Tax=Methanoregula sp. UBA64 TaxID=1915554 RepID=UPI0025E32FCD|nr:hypothetical protein [Methanoregula sp. UBA64]
MNSLSLFTAFVPWIAFALIAQAPLGNPGLSLILAFVIAIVLALATSYHQLVKGYILAIVSLAFFAVFFTLIIGLGQYYLANYIAVLSMLLLTVVSWGTIAFHFPFTLQYSREGVEPERVKSAPFMKVNYIITAVWALAFTLGFVINVFLLVYPVQGSIFWDNVQWVFMIIAIVFTIWYPAYVHKERAIEAMMRYRPDLLKKA